MVKNIKAIRIPAEDPPCVLFGEVRDSLDTYQALVGGLIEAIRLNGAVDEHGNRLPDAFGWINEEGKLIDLPHNIIATELFRRYGGLAAGDYIAGEVILLGWNEDGTNADVPEWVFAAIQSLFATTNVEEAGEN